MLSSANVVALLNLAEFVKLPFRQVLIRGTLHVWYHLECSKTWLHKITLIVFKGNYKYLLHPVAKTNQ
jgi:hypothetical protein